MATKSQGRLVVVCTDKKGVFFGLLNDTHDVGDTSVVLTEAQMCVYWSSDVKGVLGLAASGPSRSCRVTPIAPKLELNGVTAVMDATAEAGKAWRSQPWS